MRWRQIDIRVFNDSFLKAFGVTVPDLPQLFPRRHRQRTRICLSFFNEFTAKRARTVELHFDL